MILPPHNRGDLSAAQWKRIAPNLPPQKPAVGRPNNDHQTIINGILWVLRTGAPWRDIPESYGPRHSVSGRFYRWRKKGIWRPHLTKAATIAERSGKINWAIHFVDGSVVRAHQHAAGARRGELDPNNNLSAIAPWRRLPSSRHHQKWARPGTKTGLGWVGGMRPSDQHIGEGIRQRITTRAREQLGVELTGFEGSSRKTSTIACLKLQLLMKIVKIKR